MLVLFVAAYNARVVVLHGYGEDQDGVTGRNNDRVRLVHVRSPHAREP